MDDFGVLEIAKLIKGWRLLRLLRRHNCDQLCTWSFAVEVLIYMDRCILQTIRAS